MSHFSTAANKRWVFMYILLFSVNAQFGSLKLLFYFIVGYFQGQAGEFFLVLLSGWWQEICRFCCYKILCYCAFVQQSPSQLFSIIWNQVQTHVRRLHNSCLVKKKIKLISSVFLLTIFSTSNPFLCRAANLEKNRDRWERKRRTSLVSLVCGWTDVFWRCRYKLSTETAGIWKHSGVHNVASLKAGTPTLAVSFQPFWNIVISYHSCSIQICPLWTTVWFLDYVNG